MRGISTWGVVGVLQVVCGILCAHIFAATTGLQRPIAFMHADCDLYSATACIFKELRHLIQEGTVIVFDELIHYPGYEQHEWKALSEFLQDRKLDVEYLARYGEQVVVRICAH
jgi:hypothetical protein